MMIVVSILSSDTHQCKVFPNTSSVTNAKREESESIRPAIWGMCCACVARSTYEVAGTKRSGLNTSGSSKYLALLEMTEDISCGYSSHMYCESGRI